jgi:DNA invertase Pin-like site-specific DNA recombinase
MKAIRHAKSVMRQIERARAFATARGWRFDEGLVFSDNGISGGEFRHRPGLNRLLDPQGNAAPAQPLM